MEAALSKAPIIAAPPQGSKIKRLFMRFTDRQEQAALQRLAMMDPRLARELAAARERQPMTGESMP